MSHKPLWHSVTELENRDGTLFIEGCNIKELAARFGTPLYIYSEGRLRANFRRLQAAYQRYYPNFGIYYAVKANNNPAIVRVFEQEGSGADTASPAEIKIAKTVGIPAEKILFSAVYPSDEELSFAVQSGVRLNLEDVSQLERLNEMGVVPEFLSFRVNPGIGGSGKEGLVFAGPDAKFGIIERDIEYAYKRAKELGVKRFGIHMMTGSNILSPEYFEEVVGKLLSIAGPIAQRLGIAFEFIDIGGSLGVPYLPEDQELNIDEVARRVTSLLIEQLDKYQMGRPLLLHEPGRYLTCDAGVLLARVTSIKTGYKKFIGLNAGMHTLLRPALYNAYHHILYAEDLNAPCDEKVNVVGQVCENRDIFAKDRMLSSKIAPDALLALLNVGSYGFCMSSQYNSHPRAAEVLVSNGHAELIRARESYEDLVNKTFIPRHLQ